MDGKILKNSIYSVIRTFCSMIFPVITFSYASRIFLADGMGRVDFARSFITLFSLISMLGVKFYGIRECAKKRDNRHELSKIFNELFAINILATVVAYICLFIFTSINNKVSQYEIEILLYSISILLNVVGIEWLYTAVEDYKYISLRSILIQVVSLVAVLLLIHEKKDIYIYILIQVIASGGVNILGLFHARKYVDFSIAKLEDITSHIKPVLYLFLLTMFIQVFTELDTVMLGFLSNDTEVGMYSVSYKISVIMCALISAATTVIMPKIAYTFNKGNSKKADEILVASIQFIIMVGLPISIGACVFSRQFIEILSGKGYDRATLSSMILSVRTFLSPINGTILLYYLIPRGKEKESVTIAATAAGVNIVLNFILIPKGGSSGAAVATVFSEVIELVIMYFYTRKYVCFSNMFSGLYRYLLVNCPVALISLLSVHFINNSIASILISVVISVPLYIAGLLYLGNKNMKEFFSIMIRRGKHH